MGITAIIKFNSTEKTIAAISNIDYNKVYEVELETMQGNYYLMKSLNSSQFKWEDSYIFLYTGGNDFTVIMS